MTLREEIEERVPRQSQICFTASAVFSLIGLIAWSMLYSVIVDQIPHLIGAVFREFIGLST
jgi:hypothetical protein